MSETTLNEKTYMPEENIEENVITSSDKMICNSVETYANHITFMPDDMMTYYADELEEYSQEAKESILRGLKQRKTSNLGSFAEYVE